ncbi:MAG: long-chain-fatty-acid--CoA ligase [Deltaproteobacteria bacterium]|nr:long-chain-fatty-acid--CoA ligase [Deltaproteobacteria bacterium]
MYKFKTVKELITRQAQAMPDKAFMYYRDTTKTYGDLDDISNRIGNGLLSLGIKKGDRVTLLIPNRPEFIYAWFGLMKIGAVMVPINVQFKPEEVKYIVNNSEAGMVITTGTSQGALTGIKDEMPLLKHIVVVEPKDGAGIIPFGQLMSGNASVPDVRVDEYDYASFIYTSGTTGYPKGVVDTHRNYIANAHQISVAAEFTGKDRAMLILPLFHCNAQVVTVMSPMYAGASFVLMEGFSPKDFLPAIDRYRPSTFSGVPTVYAILNSLPDAGRYDLSSLRFVICGAAPMPVEVFTTFEKKYRAFILEGYGLSEATCASIINPLKGKRKIGSIGRPLDGQEALILGDNNKELPQGQIGEICIRGDVVMTGYYKNPEATAAAIKDGWLHTGDLGYVDDEGYFYIIGRKKEMIIRGGENIYPKEIEEVLYKYPKIQDAAVVGIPDPKWGEEVFGFIVPKQGMQVREQELTGFLKEKVADYKIPKKFVFLDAFPKTATGKIQKNKIIEQYALEHGIDLSKKFAVRE